jgi:hypothetical protein
MSEKIYYSGPDDHYFAANVEPYSGELIIVKDTKFDNCVNPKDAVNCTFTFGLITTMIEPNPTFKTGQLGDYREVLKKGVFLINTGETIKYDKKIHLNIIKDGLVNIGSGDIDYYKSIITYVAEVAATVGKYAKYNKKYKGALVLLCDGKNESRNQDSVKTDNKQNYPNLTRVFTSNYGILYTDPGDKKPYVHAITNNYIDDSLEEYINHINIINQNIKNTETVSEMFSFGPKSVIRYTDYNKIPFINGFHIILTMPIVEIIEIMKEEAEAEAEAEKSQGGKPKKSKKSKKTKKSKKMQKKSKTHRRKRSTRK